VATTTTIVSVQDRYFGLNQHEIVMAHVTDAKGITISQEIVPFQVNGLTVFAPVINGTATVVINTPFLYLLSNLELALGLIFPHALTAGYSGSGLLASSSAGFTFRPYFWISSCLRLLSRSTHWCNSK
jgi:hypothetical protein